MSSGSASETRSSIRRRKISIVGRMDGSLHYGCARDYIFMHLSTVDILVTHPAFNQRQDTEDLFGARGAGASLLVIIVFSTLAMLL